MVALALSLGIYSYLILALGLLGLLYKQPVFLVSLPFLVVWGVWGIRGVWRVKKTKMDWRNWGILGLLGVQVLINFLGALSPELSFDALWYHLTAAKLYVQNHQIFYIPGWLLWPANLPRFTEMFYTTALLFSNEILVKLIHLSFGILSAIALFNLLKRYLSLKLSLLGVVTFYTMLIVGWQSTTAYVDLSRTFFEILALDLFLQWFETKKENFLWESALMVGLAISTKILAFGTLGTLGILILLVSKEKKLERLVKFVLLVLLVVSPWLVFSGIHTGNPLFPLFGSLQETSFSVAGPGLPWIIQNLGKLPLLLWRVTLYPDDIISPVYLIFLPLVLLLIWTQKPQIKITALYCLLGIFFAPIESNRYLLPYLPGFTLVTLGIFNHKWTKVKLMEKFLIFIILFSAVLNLGSRGLATRKFLPYLLGQETKTQFLVKRLNFSFGDFYDVDGWFSENIQKDDLVLIYGIHNLYYVNFPYVHESYALPGTYFTHILVGDNQDLPKKFGKRFLIYQNPKTQVKLYLFGGKYQ